MYVRTATVNAKEYLSSKFDESQGLKGQSLEAIIHGIMCDTFVLNIETILKSLMEVKDIPSLLTKGVTNGNNTTFNGPARQKRYAQVKEIVQDITSEYFKEKGQILELGAGFPCHNSQSLLTSMFPEGLQKDITATDLNPNASKKAQEGGYTRYRKMDALQIELPASSMTYVISCCFMDVLTKANLEKVLLEVKRVIKDQGTVVHFSDLDPYVNTLFHECITATRLPVPLTDGERENILGVQWIEQEVYEKQLRKKLKEEKCDLGVQFLDWVCKLSPIQREMMLNQLYSLELCAEISAWFQQIVPEAFRQTLWRSTFFENTLRETVTHAGFEIVKMEYRTREVLTPNQADKIKQTGGNVNNSLGKEITIDESLEKDTLKTLTKVHVLVAKKI